MQESHAQKKTQRVFLLKYWIIFAIRQIKLAYLELTMKLKGFCICRYAAKIKQNFSLSMPPSISALLFENVSHKLVLKWQEMAMNPEKWFCDFGR